MRSVGLITEYNPFHNGHLHHLHASLQAAAADLSVAVMSGHFLQRGEPALVDKWVRTEMADRSAVQEAKDRGVTFDQVWEERAALYPAGRVVTPEEVAETIAFLAAEESSGVSGEAIRVALGTIW